LKVVAVTRDPAATTIAAVLLTLPLTTTAAAVLHMTTAAAVLHMTTAAAVLHTTTAAAVPLTIVPVATMIMTIAAPTATIAAEAVAATIVTAEEVITAAVMTGVMKDVATNLLASHFFWELHSAEASFQRPTSQSSNCFLMRISIQV
jgi:hypothetical protein